MDVRVKRIAGTAAWSLRDLLGRSMGSVAEDTPGTFVIIPEGNAIGTMKDIRRGPHATLDAALAEIEMHTRGVCRREADDPAEGGAA